MSGFIIIQENLREGSYSRVVLLPFENCGKSESGELDCASVRGGGHSASV